MMWKDKHVHITPTWSWRESMATWAVWILECSNKNPEPVAAERLRKMSRQVNNITVLIFMEINYSEWKIMVVINKERAEKSRYVQENKVSYCLANTTGPKRSANAAARDWMLEWGSSLLGFTYLQEGKKLHSTAINSKFNHTDVWFRSSFISIPSFCLFLWCSRARQKAQY